MPIPKTEYGKDWLNCLSYEGPGALDPTGGKLPQGWDFVSLVKAVKLMRGTKIITVPGNAVQKGDKIIKTVLNEEIIGALYEGDPKAILLSDAKGRMIYTRLGWYKKFGRDGLRTVCTGRIIQKVR
jgi:hypothetical protein